MSRQRPASIPCQGPRVRVLFALLSVCLFAVLLLLPGGCAARAPHPLLKENHAAMTDAGILRYYYDLGEAIGACENSRYSGPNVGLGGRTGSHGSGVGVGLEFPMGSGCDASALRDRRAEVRTAISQRGLTP